MALWCHAIYSYNAIINPLNTDDTYEYLPILKVYKTQLNSIIAVKLIKCIRLLLVSGSTKLSHKSG